MMATTLAIWRQPVAERRAAGSLWLTWFLLALCALGTASATIDSPKAHVMFAFFTGVPMGMLLIMWWLYSCSNVKAQCHPAALQLVPALRPRMVRAMMHAWFAIIAIMTLLVGVPTGYPVLVAIVTALVLIELSFAGIWRNAVLGMAMMLLPLILPLLAAWLGGFLATPAGLAAGALLVLVEGAMAVRRLPRQHAAAPAGTALRAKIEERMRMPGPGGCPASRVDRSVDPQPAFLRPLGRSWLGSQWMAIGVVTILCAAYRIWAAWQQPGAGDLLAMHRTMVAIVMPGFLAAAVYREAQRFATARTEQALLCLTPGAPDHANMNQVLAGLLLRGFARSWLILGLLTLAALAVLGMEVANLARMGAAWMATLPLVTVAMRDFARAGGAPGLAATPLMTLLIWLAFAASNGVGAPALWLALAAGGLLSGLTLARWRWHVMLAAVPALPAGRVQDKRSVR